MSSERAKYHETDLTKDVMVAVKPSTTPSRRFIASILLVVALVVLVVLLATLIPIYATGKDENKGKQQQGFSWTE